MSARINSTVFMLKIINKNLHFFKNATSASAMVMIVSVVFFCQHSKIRSATSFNLIIEDQKNSTEVKEISLDKKLFEFGLYVNKLSVWVPVVSNVDGTNKTAYNKALLSGVAHHKNTALPGKKGNIFIFGHSSTWNGTGQYAEVFKNLNNLEKNDQIIIYYQNKEYKYSVWQKEVIAADDFSYLEPTKKEQLTLMTCWPVGSNLKRLVVIARLGQ